MTARLRVAPAAAAGSMGSECAKLLFNKWSILQKTKEQIENRLSMTMRGLKVWTAEEKSWWRKKVTKQKMMILNDGKK